MSILLFCYLAKHGNKIALFYSACFSQLLFSISVVTEAQFGNEDDESSDDDEMVTVTKRRRVTAFDDDDD